MKSVADNLREAEEMYRAYQFSGSIGYDVTAIECLSDARMYWDRAHEADPMHDDAAWKMTELKERPKEDK